jgi:hypothetical protein
MATEKISIKVGIPVEGADFYGREKELEYAWKYHISKGVSLLLSAPRRVGKSSFSKMMLKRAEENGWKTLYLDLQGIGTESEFVKLFKEELKSAKWWNKAGDFVVKIFDSIQFDKISISIAEWRNDTYRQIRHVIENTGDILIVIDELTIFLDHLLRQEDGKEKVEFFLEWLRKFRQKSRIKVRWIFCSSVGIENFASMHQLSKHLNDIHPFPIGAFSVDEAKDFISRLDVDEKAQFTKEHIQHILDKLVWHLPFFIKLLVEKINYLICIDGRCLSNDTIDDAYNRLLIENKKEFSTWDKRLKYYYDFEDNARKILDLCTLPAGRSRKDLLANLSTPTSDMEKIETTLAKLLDMLKNDGYLAEYNGKYVFRSPLLRDFWHNRFIK